MIELFEFMMRILGRFFTFSKRRKLRNGIRLPIWSLSQAAIDWLVQIRAVTYSCGMSSLTHYHQSDIALGT